jgi:hypothetical protein
MSSYTGTSSAHPVQVLRQDGTPAQEITFLPGQRGRVGHGGGQLIKIIGC